MSKKAIRLGLYGCGNRTKALLDSIRGEGEYEVVAAYDVRKEAVDALCAKYGGKPCSSSAELVSCKNADAFLISLDPFAHPKAFYETLAAGKPFFIEKPVSLQAREAYCMMKKAREKKVQVHVGFMRRYLPCQKAARRFLAENDPGKLFSIATRWFHAGETEMISCLKNDPNNFRLKLSQIPFHCCHALDCMILLAGRPKSVFSRGLKLVDRIYPSPDEVISSIEFENGMIGSFHYSSMAWNSGGPHVLHAENYSLQFDDACAFQVYHHPQYAWQRESDNSTYRKFVGPDEQNFGLCIPETEIMTDFLRCVRSGEPMKANMEDAWRVAELAEAIEESYKRNEKISLPINVD